MDKLRAAFIHFCISAAIVGPVLILIFFVWYPEPFFSIVGAWDVVKVLVGVDLVLGPFLTLIVYRRAKPRLALDLGVIAAIQLTALVYGVHTIYGERPYYLVFAVDRMNLLAARDVDRREAEALGLRKPFIGPLKAIAEVPKNQKEQQRLLFELLEGAPDIEYRPEYWRPYDGQIVLAKSKPLADLLQLSAATAPVIQEVERQTGRDRDQLRYLPIVAKQGHVFVAVLNEQGDRFVSVLPINPWDLARDQG